MAAEFSVTHEWKNVQLNLSRQPLLLLLFQRSQHFYVETWIEAMPILQSLSLSHAHTHSACPLSLNLSNAQLSELK